jgi:predicted PurR-regulated permease PerM
MRDRIAEFFEEKTARRVLLLALFLGLLFTFRHLLVLLAFFVVFERALALSAGAVGHRFKWGKAPSLLAVLGTVAAVVGLTLWLTAGRIAHAVMEARDTLPARIAAMREHPAFLQLQEHLPDSEKLAQSAERYAADVVKSAEAIGHLFLMALIGLVLGIVYFLDTEKIQAFSRGLDPRSLLGALARWLNYTAEAVTLTIQMQLIVAACNAVLTLPVLLFIGVPHVAALMLLIFVAGLIPVVGNLISGTVLVLLAFQVKGWLGVGIFVVLTFVLHKIESYYLNPRLSARHVALPGFVLILSLLAFEHLFGFVGLFLSFPSLFVANKIRREFAAEDAPASPTVEIEAPKT